VRRDVWERGNDLLILSIGVIMGIVLFYKIAAEDAEVVYSGAGISSKLAILFGDLAAFKNSLGGAIGVFLTLTISNVLLVYFGLLRRRNGNSNLAASNRF
jgi:hypothetical protein